MALAMLLALAVLGIALMLLVVRDSVHAAAHQLLWQCLEQLRQMILLVDMVHPHILWKMRAAAMEVLVFFAARYFPPFAGGLVLCFWLCWWLWKGSRELGSSRKHGSARRFEEEEEEEEEEEDSLLVNRFEAEHLGWPVPNRKEMCTVVEELVNELLRVCQKLSGCGFVPQLQPAVGLGVFQGERDPGEDVVYQLLVPLKPPPGHSFHLKEGTEGDALVRNFRLQVNLECVCTMEQWLGDMLCFVHSTDYELMRTQDASLLQTLCAHGSYLDVKKTTDWLQQMMTAACAVVSQRTSYKLTVLPSRRCCRIKLTNNFIKPIFIELIMVVQHGDWETFVTIE